MADTSGTSWLETPVPLTEGFLSDSSKLIKGKLKPEYSDGIKFHETIETGIRDFYNFHQADTQKLSKDVRYKRIADVKKQTSNLAKAINLLHIDDSNFIMQHNLLNTKKHHYGNADYENPQKLIEELEHLSVACENVIGALQGKKQGIILWLPINLNSAITRYAKEKVSAISDSASSFFVSYLDLVLIHLSDDERFGQQEYVFDRKYSDSLARSLAKSLNNYK